MAMSDSAIRAKRILQDALEENMALLQDIVECSQRGIIYGVHITYCPFALFNIGEAQQDDHAHDHRKTHQMMIDAIKTGCVKSLRRHSSFTEHYFMGESRPDLVDRLKTVKPENVGDYGSIIGCMSVAVFPKVAVYDPEKIGVANELQRIEALLREVGITDQH